MGDLAISSRGVVKSRPNFPNRKEESPGGGGDVSAMSSVEEQLNGLGARVFLPPDSGKGREKALKLCRKGNSNGNGKGSVDVDADDDLLWGNIAGYHKQKREIEDSLLLNLLSPSTLEKIAKGTREHYISNLPKAVLFDGPPGTGKTSSARALAAMAVIPLVYVPVESITSKYYGESEKILSQIFQQCSSFKEGCIVFIDEIDSLITSRDSEMHEASRRILGVLLKEVDGFEEGAPSVVIAATNRKQDLDLALLNRFDTIIHFELPDAACRAKILQKYAKHLGEGQLAELGELTAKMSGRDLKDICLQAERRWASKILEEK
jgi:SpoVK/Ycf46/Vps4 family AAA+-type ATPase